MLFYKKETLYLSGTYWNFNVYKIQNGASPFRSILLRKKSFINKISDYSDLYSFGYLVEKIVIIDKLYLKDFDYNE